MLAPPHDLYFPAVRPLTAADSTAYRTLRQRVLNTDDACYFSDSYERERHLTESQWLRWCTETPAHCILGTFADNTLVGIIMITRQGSPDSPLVEWEAAWLDPRYRGTGIGKLAYQQARQWSHTQGYKFVVGFIRDTYTPALDICRKQGFVYAYTIQDEVWADGSIADTKAFLLDLRPQASEYIAKPVFERFQEVFPFLNQGVHAPPRQNRDKIA